MSGRGAPIIGADKPRSRYLGCYRDPVTNEPGPEIWLPGHELALICGAPRSGKDTGIIIPNALMREGVTDVFMDTRLEAAAITAPYRRSLGPAYMGNPCNELVNLVGYEDLRSDRANLLKGRNSIPTIRSVWIICSSWSRRYSRMRATVTPFSRSRARNSLPVC